MPSIDYDWVGISFATGQRLRKYTEKTRPKQTLGSIASVAIDEYLDKQEEK
jgi:hypothetical protein